MKISRREEIFSKGFCVKAEWR